MEDKNLHFVGNVAQKAIIEHEGKVLVCRGIGDITWEFPGGRLHQDEEPQDGLIREIREEFGLNLIVDGPLDTCRSFHERSGRWNIFIAYRCHLDDAHKMEVNTSEIEEAKWVSKEELKTLSLFDDCRQAADTFLKLTV